MKQQHTDMIRLFQPFQKDSVVGSHLWMLNSICNIDKHRHLNIVAFHSVLTAELEEGVDPGVIYPRTGGLSLVHILKGTEYEDKMIVKAIPDICFVDEELEAASAGYGSAIEREGIKRPPVTPVLWECITAVQFVVDRFTSGFMADKRIETN